MLLNSRCRGSDKAHGCDMTWGLCFAGQPPMMFMGPRGPFTPAPGQAYMVPGYGLVMPHPMQVAMAQGQGPPMFQPAMMGPGGRSRTPSCLCCKLKCQVMWQPGSEQQWQNHMAALKSKLFASHSTSIFFFQLQQWCYNRIFTSMHHPLSGHKSCSQCFPLKCAVTSRLRNEMD